MYVYIYIYIYIYFSFPGGPSRSAPRRRTVRVVPVPVSARTRNPDFRGFDSDILLYLRGGTPKSNFPEIQTQRCLVCGFLVCGSPAVMVTETRWD